MFEIRCIKFLLLFVFIKNCYGQDNYLLSFNDIIEKPKIIASLVGISLLVGGIGTLYSYFAYGSIEKANEKKINDLKNDLESNKYFINEILNKERNTRTIELLSKTFNKQNDTESFLKTPNSSVESFKNIKEIYQENIEALTTMNFFTKGSEENFFITDFKRDGIDFAEYFIEKLDIKVLKLDYFQLDILKQLLSIIYVNKKVNVNVEKHNVDALNVSCIVFKNFISISLEDKKELFNKILNSRNKKINHFIVFNFFPSFKDCQVDNLLILLSSLFSLSLISIAIVSTLNTLCLMLTCGNMGNSFILHIPSVACFFILFSCIYIGSGEYVGS
jgi:hypothetical protein